MSRLTMFAARHRAATGFLAGVLVTGALVGTGAAIAAIPSTTTGQVSACVNRTSGSVRIIDYQAGRRCTAAERLVSWGEGYRWRGAWSPTASYAVLDVVVSDGSSFVARTPSRGRAPSSTAAAWGLLASRGADGLAGPAGVAGPGGPAGTQGAPGAAGAPGSGAPGAPGPTGATGATGATGGAGTTGTTGATGPAGPSGPSGPTGPAGVTGPGGVRGQLVYTVGAQFDAPAGVTQVMLELWGGGGGGGCGATGANALAGTSRLGGGGGGGGSSGGWARVPVPVIPGQAYTVTVGARGASCVLGTPGASDGTATSFTGPGLIVPVSVSVPGGLAGGDGQAYDSGTNTPANGGAGGVGGASASGAGFVLPYGAITHGSNPGGYGNRGQAALFPYDVNACGRSGPGAAPPAGSVDSVYGAGSSGGYGGCLFGASGGFADGTNGLVIVTW